MDYNNINAEPLNIQIASFARSLENELRKQNEEKFAELSKLNSLFKIKNKPGKICNLYFPGAYLKSTCEVCSPSSTSIFQNSFQKLTLVDLFNTKQCKTLARKKQYEDFSVKEINTKTSYLKRCISWALYKVFSYLYKGLLVHPQQLECLRQAQNTGLPVLYMSNKTDTKSLCAIYLSTYYAGLRTPFIDVNDLTGFGRCLFQSLNLIYSSNSNCNINISILTTNLLPYYIGFNNTHYEDIYLSSISIGYDHSVHVNYSTPYTLSDLDNKLLHNASVEEVSNGLNFLYKHIQYDNNENNPRTAQCLIAFIIIVNSKNKKITKYKFIQKFIKLRNELIQSKQYLNFKGENIKIINYVLPSLQPHIQISKQTNVEPGEQSIQERTKQITDSHCRSIQTNVVQTSEIQTNSTQTKSFETNVKQTNSQTNVVQTSEIQTNDTENNSSQVDNFQTNDAQTKSIETNVKQTKSQTNDSQTSNNKSHNTCNLFEDVVITILNEKELLSLCFPLIIQRLLSSIVITVIYSMHCVEDSKASVNGWNGSGGEENMKNQFEELLTNVDYVTSHYSQNGEQNETNIVFVKNNRNSNDKLMKPTSNPPNETNDETQTQTQQRGNKNNVHNFIFQVNRKDIIKRSLILIKMVETKLGVNLLKFCQNKYDEINDVIENCKTWQILELDQKVLAYEEQRSYQLAFSIEPDYIHHEHEDEEDYEQEITNKIYNVKCLEKNERAQSYINIILSVYRQSW